MSTAIGILMSILGTIGTIFLIRLLDTMKSLATDVNGIKVEIGKVITTQVAHADKFEDLEDSITELRKKVYA